MKNSKFSNFSLVVVSALITTIIALLVIRVMAPELLGLNKDLQLVKMDKEVLLFIKIFSERNMKMQRNSY